jgi:hypothetical protein
MLLESVHELNRALALLAATSLMSRYLDPADRAANAFDRLLSGSGRIAEEAAGKLDRRGQVQARVAVSVNKNQEEDPVPQTQS